MKKCGKCKEVKLLIEYYNNASYKDGLFPWCKVCVKRYDTEKRINNPEYNKYKKLVNTKWRKEHKDIYKNYAKKYRKNNPKKIIAQQIAKKIKIIGLCYFCSSNSNLLRHHPDYNLPEQIIILCKSCHRKLHNILKVSKT